MLTSATQTVAEGFSHENLMDLLLITVPTVLLALTTLWDNDRMFKVATQALALLGLKKKKEEAAEAVANHEVEFHGKHELLTDVDNTVSTIVKDVEGMFPGKEKDTPKLVQKDE